MKITTLGTYQLTKDITIRTSISVGTLPKGSLFSVNQIDKENHKVYANELEDWHYYDIPCKKVSDVVCCLNK